jgi:hypothetical protein
MSEENTAPEYTPIQQKAVEQGWKPKEQFEGNEEDFIDAPEFVRRGELFSKIEHQGKELKSVKQALDAMKQHYTKVAEVEFNRALKTLQTERKQAMREGETDKALLLEEQIEEAKEQHVQLQREAVQATNVPTINPEFTAWVDQNKWYASDKAMRAVADQVGLELHAQGVSPSEVLKRVEKEVREAFPHKFQPKRTANPVEGSSRSGTTVQRASVALDDTERGVMKKLVASGVMTEEEYMRDLKKIKGGSSGR